jgi:hypothetical protein
VAENYFQHAEHYFRSMAENPNYGDRQAGSVRIKDYGSIFATRLTDRRGKGGDHGALAGLPNQTMCLVPKLNRRRIRTTRLACQGTLDMTLGTLFDVATGEG